MYGTFHSCEPSELKFLACKLMIEFGFKRIKLTQLFEKTDFLFSRVYEIVSTPFCLVVACNSVVMRFLCHVQKNCLTLIKLAGI